MRFSMLCSAGAALLPVVGSCGERDSHVLVLPQTERIVHSHGILVGDSIGRLELLCPSSGTRPFPGGPELQLVTLSSPSDCSSCLPHLSGLEQVTASGKLPASNFFIVWAPGQDRAAVLRAYRSLSQRQVCFDERGDLWKAHRIAGTPVTIGVKGNRVVYMNDLPLTSPALREQLVADVRLAELASADKARRR